MGRNYFTAFSRQSSAVSQRFLNITSIHTLREGDPQRRNIKVNQLGQQIGRVGLADG